MAEKNGIDRIMYDMLKQTGRRSVYYGDRGIIRRCAKRAGIAKSDHSETAAVVLAALERSKLFKKTYTIKSRNGRRRKYRLFTII